MSLQVLEEHQTEHQCVACGHRLVRRKVDQDGEIAVGFACGGHSYDPFGVYRQCNYWLICYNGGRKVPRESKLKTLPKLVR
jgi:hypothetical protein